MVLAALAGAATVLGFAPFGYFAAPLVSLIVLLALWARCAEPRRGGWLGLSFGLGQFLLGVSWVYVSLHTFGMMPAPLAAIATLLFCAVLALFPAMLGWLCVRLGMQRPGVVLLAFPGAWVLLEWLRGWLFTGFPWLGLGYTHIDTPLAGYAPVTGVYGLSLAVAATAVLGWIVVRGPFRHRAAALVLVGVLFLVGSALKEQAWTRPTGSRLDVALLQGNIPQEMKFVPGRFESTLATYARLAQQTNARLIVLPETAIPRFPDEVPPAFFDMLRKHVAPVEGDVLLGLPTGDLRSAYFNTMQSIGTSPTQHYSKSHLVPFGEFIPWGFGWIERILRIPLSNFAPGEATQRPLALAGEQLAVNICYEDVFGAEIIRQLPQATLLVNASNVAWFGDSLAPHQHLEMARMRSIETGRYMLRATNSGMTAIIDQRGRVQDVLPQFTEGVLMGPVRGFSGATPYVHYGDWVVGLAGLMLAVGVIGAIARQRRRDARLA